MATYISHSPVETEALAARLATALKPGCVIGLAGDLGAGKTQFVRGLVRGLHAAERVHSPTFALLNVYSSGRLPVYHIDLYRLDSDEQIYAAGLDEYLVHPDGVAVVEWIDRWRGAKPPCFRRVQIEITGESERQITYDDFGA